MTRAALAVVILLLASSTSGRADEGNFVLRFATVAPSGSSWAREFGGFARNLERSTEGHVKVKWYFNGVAGGEIEMGERVRQGQLDGIASGQMLCERLAPSMRITRLPGVFQSREETAAVMNHLMPRLQWEAHQHGFVLLGTSGIGPDVMFSRAPVRSMEDLRKQRLFRWDLDEVGIAMSREMGMTVTPLPLENATRNYDENKIDGFVSPPAAALAFQWSAQAKYVTDLRASYIWACLLMSEQSWQRLPPRYQTLVREQQALLRVRLEDTGAQIDEQLLGGLFQKQGLQVLKAPERFRAEFFAAARSAREKLSGKFVSRELITSVLQLLADYRGEHAH
jgi:TRAP-type C4-dicarboxylate transport system substrate-binding protein